MHEIESLKSLDGLVVTLSAAKEKYCESDKNCIEIHYWMKAELDPCHGNRQRTST